MSEALEQARKMVRLLVNEHAEAIQIRYAEHEYRLGGVVAGTIHHLAFIRATPIEGLPVLDVCDPDNPHWVKPDTTPSPEGLTKPAEPR